jgi:HTH-type transcriptional regulator/antitoxin HigA
MRPIETRDEHQAAFLRLEELMIANPEPGTVEADELEELAKIIQEYEKKTFTLLAFDLDGDSTNTP